MATYYFVIAEEDMWWVRVRGRAYGGFLLRSHAVKQAVHSARKCRGEAYVVVQESQFRWRIEWSSQAEPLAEDVAGIAAEATTQDSLAAG
jgi:hypothetical protein